jgi:hypothetical protein
MQNNSNSVIFNFCNDLLFASGIEAVQYSVINQDSGEVYAYAKQLNATAIQVGLASMHSTLVVKLPHDLS